VYQESTGRGRASEKRAAGGREVEESQESHVMEGAK
jgi:hypothetical protein